MKGFLVYEIRNVTNGKVYIGSTIDTRVRFQRHRRELRAGKHSNAHLQNAWNTYGEDAFKFSVLHSFDSEADMHVYEEGLIRADFDDTHTKIYNAKVGVLRAPLHSQETKGKISIGVKSADARGKGKRYHKVTQETRKRMSEALKGNTCARGYKRTDSEKAAIAVRMKGNQNWLGRTHTAESVEKMGITAFAEDPTGNITRYPSINAMREALGMAGLSNLLRAIKTGEPFTLGGHAGWRFFTDDEDNRAEIPNAYKDLPRSRPEALKQGAKMYFTGKPCKHGHIAPRLTKGTCLECRKIEVRKSTTGKS